MISKREGEKTEKKKGLYPFYSSEKVGVVMICARAPGRERGCGCLGTREGLNYSFEFVDTSGSFMEFLETSMIRMTLDRDFTFCLIAKTDIFISGGSGFRK